MKTSGKLYMIPNVLGEHAADHAFPIYNREVIRQIRHYAVEQVKPARRLIRMLDNEKVIDECVFYEMGVQVSSQFYIQIISLIKNGESVGVVSDAGCPGVADPGSALVRCCQENEIEVVPLVGPSSILLALMASGLNGQQFCFHGYLPKEELARKLKIEKILKDDTKLIATHLFIETPYRNDHLLQSMIQTLPESMRLCIATDILTPKQQIKTRAVIDWKKDLPVLKGRQVIFIFGQPA